MKVFVFGNALIDEDRAAGEAARLLAGRKEFAAVEFVFCSSYDEMVLRAGGGRGRIVILDAVDGIKEPKILGVKDLQPSRPFSGHDLDLGFFLKLMKPKKVKIIGVPKAGKKGEPGAKTIEKAGKLLLESVRGA